MLFVEKIAHNISQKNRTKKHALFLAYFDPKNNTTLLDVGVTNKEYSQGDNYLEKHYPYPKQITAVTNEPLTEFPENYPEVTAISADATSLPFPNDAFDIAYSNAVIEHVGDREKQVQFLKEMYRVAKSGYCTTPNKFFPVELHTRIPFLHFLLPKKYFDMFLRAIGKGWAAGGYMYLLSESDMRDCLRCSGIKHYTFIKNRFLGMPITFTVLWKK